MTGAAAVVRRSPGSRSATVLPTNLAALGIVFGDIDTSPLYPLKTVLDLAGGSAERSSASALGQTRK